jgi:hypothetical protein
MFCYNDIRSIKLFLTDDIIYASQHNVHREVRAMVFIATFNNISFISWWFVLLVEETEVLRENQ